MEKRLKHIQINLFSQVPVHVWPGPKSIGNRKLCVVRKEQEHI